MTLDEMFPKPNGIDPLTRIDNLIIKGVRKAASPIEYITGLNSKKLSAISHTAGSLALLASAYYVGVEAPKPALIATSIFSVTALANPLPKNRSLQEEEIAYEGVELPRYTGKAFRLGFFGLAAYFGVYADLFANKIGFESSPVETLQANADSTGLWFASAAMLLYAGAAYLAKTPLKNNFSVK